jgi:SMP-30/Gluconolactonase/LRE-like region
VVVKRDGSIWFTDPPYGIVSNREGHVAPRELNSCCVFRFDPRTAALRIASDIVEEPNGLAFSPHERVLYVSDTSAALRPDGSGHHHIVAFDVVDGQDLAHPRVFAVIEPGLADGLRVDVNGFVQQRRQRAGLPPGRHAHRAHPGARDSGQPVFWRRAARPAVHHRQHLAVPHRAQHPRRGALTSAAHPRWTGCRRP